MAEEKFVKIGDKNYKLDTLSAEAKAHLTNLRMVDQELARLQQQQAIAKTARNAYANALKAELPSDGA